MQQRRRNSLRESDGRRTPVLEAGVLKTFTLAALVAGAAGLAFQACVPDAPAGLDEGGDAPDPGSDDPDPRGAVVASVAIEGPESPDTLMVSVDGAEPEPVAAGESLTWTDLPAGEVALELLGLPVNCAVQGENPRQVTVVAEAETQVEFTIVCVPLVGDLRVTASTYGDDTDRDGYRVELDGGAEKQQVEANGSVTFTGLALGQHSVRLRDVHKDCEVETENPTDVDVEFGELAELDFLIECDD